MMPIERRVVMARVFRQDLVVRIGDLVLVECLLLSMACGGYL